MEPPVARLAVDAASLPHEACITLPKERSTRIVEALQELCGGNATTVGQLLPDIAERVKLKGPGWAILSIDEADGLQEKERRKLVPIRSMSSLATIKAWSPEALTMELLDGSGDALAEVEVNFDFKTVEITYGGESIFDGKAEGDELSNAWATLRRSMCVRSPIKGVDAPTDAATPFTSRSVTGSNSNSSSSSLSAAPTSYVLPNWVGEMAVRWLSNCWRLHVIFHASLPNGISRPLTLNGAYMTRVVANGRYSEEGSEHWRLSLVVHESSCRCFCNAWKRDRGDASRLGTPKRVAIALDFCGGKKMDGYCPRHPEVPGRSFREPKALLDVCMRKASMTMSCRHAGGPNGGTAPTCPTQVKLPSAMCADSFAESLMTVARTLCDPAAEHTQEDLDELREFLDTALAETALDHATAWSAADNVMEERDCTVAAMLETGQYFVAPKRKHGPPVLQQRNVSQRVPAFLDEAMATHSHLLPCS